MAQIGRRIFYSLADGAVMCDTGEKEGAVKETPPEVDFPSYDPQTMGVIELEFGRYAENFARLDAVRVDPQTRELIFTPREE